MNEKKSQNSLTHSSRSYRSWLAGIFLSIACVLFIVSHIHARWSIFPFEYRDISSVNSGLWRRNTIYNGRSITFKIKCMNERVPCTKLIIARIFMVMACITSGIGGICLCILPTFKNKYKSILYISGLILAFLSFVFGLIGFLTGISWVIQFERDTIGSAAICALIGSFLSLGSAICAFFINSNEST